MLHHCIYPTARTVLYPSSTVLCQKRFVPRSTAHAVHGKQSHYEVLGLTPAASHADIRQAFVRLSKEIHPDRNPNDPDNHIKFVRLNEAYTVLSKHHTRREYDVSLAYWIRMQSQAKSHTVGHTSAPGFGGPRPDDPASDPQQHRFWDETIFEMRDRTKDANAFYPEDSYYGIRGIRRQSNGVIAALCGVVVLLGFGYSQHKASEYQKQVSRVNRQLLRETRERARRNGTARQIELFSAIHSAKENSASDDESPANVSGES